MISERGGWGEIDRTADPAGYIEYLRSVSALESIQQYKRATFRLMAVAAGQRVLDVGCGRGDEVIALARLVGVDGASVGLDASETMIAQAERRAKEAGVRAEFKVGDAYALPFPDESFDGCRIDRTLQHLADPGRAIRELRRVTRPGGRIVAAEPDWGTLAVDAPDTEATDIIVRAHIEHIANGRVGRELWRRFADAGLEEVVVEAGGVLLMSLAIADPVLGLAESAREAVGDGTIAAERADAWVASLREADGRTRFFVSLTGFLVSGRVSTS